MIIKCEVGEVSENMVVVNFSYDGQKKPEGFGLCKAPSGRFVPMGWKIPKVFEGKVFASANEAVEFVNSL